jgi:alkylmercury lyase-like protein
MRADSESMSMSPTLAAALNAAAIPLFKVGPARHARLSDSERALYFWILHRFGSTGRPSGAETREAAEGFGLDAARALETLAREDLVHTDGGEEIVVAYPFSGRPTEHRVRFHAGHQVHAMCAIDALGMAPMFDEPIEIVSRDPLTCEGIEVALAPDGAGSWQPEQAVVVCGASGAASPAAAAARC